MHVTWREYDLVEATEDESFRREMTWQVFDEQSNRLANLLLSRGVHKGDKVAILLYNCIEWLPIFFGVLKTGATVVPLNFRYSADEIDYCIDRSDADILIFGPEFIGRVEQIVPKIQRGRLLFFVGDDCPTWAESYRELAMVFSVRLLRDIGGIPKGRCQKAIGLCGCILRTLTRIHIYANWCIYQVTYSFL